MGYYSGEEARKLEANFERKELEKSLREAKEDLQDLPLFIHKLEEHLERVSKTEYTPAILLSNDTKVKLLNAPISLQIKPCGFPCSGLEVLRDFSTYGFNDKEALACIGELVHRFSIPRDRIFVQHSHSYDHEKYEKYVHKIFDRLYQDQGVAKKDKVQERSVKVEYLTKFDMDLVRFTFPAQGILSFNQQELCEFLRSELLKINYPEERMHKGYVATKREGKQMMWTVSFFINYKERVRKIFNTGDKVRIKDMPRSYKLAPYRGYEGVVYGHHYGKDWGDGMWDDELVLITIEMENGSKMALGVDPDDIE